MSEGALSLRGVSGRQPAMRALSDARLAKLAASGSRPAFAAIYQRHHQAIYRYCRSLLGSEHDALDALQNTMLKAMRGLEGEPREISLRPWLFRIAHNEAISLLRRRPTDAPIEAAAELADSGGAPDARERLRHLIEDLDQLTVRQRSALVMRELNGLGFAEIAAALETSAAGAKQSLYEARLALHEFEEGREMSCDEICFKISSEDRRLLRARRVRAHLKGCADCRRFEAQFKSRRQQLAAIAPPLSVPVALGILGGVLGGGGGGGAVAATGGGTAAVLGGSLAVKLGVAGVLALGVGTAALETNRSGAAPGSPTTPSAAEPPDTGGETRTRAGGSGPGSAGADARAGKRNGDAAAGRGGGRSSNRPDRHGFGADEASHANLSPGAAEATPAGNDATPSGAGAGSAPSDSGQAPPSSPSPVPSTPNEPAPASGGTPHGPTGLPPGHGGVPLGHE